jgi:hypothetical protein
MIVMSQPAPDGHDVAPPNSMPSLAGTRMPAHAAPAAAVAYAKRRMTRP